MERKIEKTDGKGNIHIIDNPNFYDEDGNFRKFRNKMTHLKPKKKKRKK